MKPILQDNDNRFISKYDRAINDMTESEYNNFTLWGELDEIYGESDHFEEGQQAPKPKSLLGRVMAFAWRN